VEPKGLLQIHLSSLWRDFQRFFQMPSCLGKGFYSLLAGNHRQHLWHQRSDRHFHNPAHSDHKPFSFFSQRFQAAYYCFLDVPQSLLRAVAL
jgi:hypothetical protein